MKLSIDHNNPMPLYLQVEVLLRKMINLPKYQNGELLPNEVEMASELGISRNTLRQATNKLVYEGLLFRKKGFGTIVTKPMDTKANNWKSFTQEMLNKGMKVVNYEFSISRCMPSEAVSKFMGITTETEVLKMERLRGNEEKAFVYFISYFHPRIGLTGKEDFNRPLYDILQNDYKIYPKLSKEEITAIRADEILANKLNIDLGSPVLKRKRFVYDPGRRPIEFNIGYYRSDSIVYRVESERER